MERVTIDQTVALAYLNPREDSHEDAKRLFTLAREGEVEVASATSGRLVDARGDLREQLSEMFEREGVAETDPLPYPSDELFPSDDLFPSEGVEELRRAWNAVAAEWKAKNRKPPEPADCLHVETHVRDARDVFITDDKRLLDMCYALRDEHGIAIEAMRLGEYLARRS